MPKYWSGIETKKVTENGRERTLVVCMTPEEYNDRIYREELIGFQEEKMRDELRNMPAPKNPPPKKRQEIREFLKERQEYLRRRRESPNPKYF